MKNLMEFTEEKFEQLSHGKIGNIAVTPYKGPTWKEIGIKEKDEDLGMITNEKLKFDLIEKNWFSKQVISDNKNFHHKREKADVENV